MNSVSEEMLPDIRKNVFEKTIGELARREIVYKGILYAGLMIDKKGGFKVLELNCRFGDPETQVILPRIEGDLLPALFACVSGTLAGCTLKWKKDACVSVVMASGGYPGKYEKGRVITGINEAAKLKDTVVFHAGTSLNSGKRLPPEDVF